IQRRIAELDGDDASVRHRILVTSAQHDAVENVVARTKVFGLPAVKVGARRGGDGAGLDGAELFQADQADQIRASLESEAETERLRVAREHVATLLALPGTPSQNADRLRAVREAIAGLVPPALVDAVAARERALRSQRPPDDDRKLQRRAASGLPCTAAQFEDGGPRASAKALQRLGAILTDDERRLLEGCARWVGDAAPPWIGDLGPVRDALLDRLQPTMTPRECRLDGETRATLVELVEAMREGLRTRRTREESVVANFLHELETDPDGVRETLQEYTAVLASTLQHSAAKPMREVRGINTGNLEFESVLVDEAARAHPLDLFVPISMGRRRIVLVGDHRQLPHMLEPEVERAILSGDLSGETERALKESLFQRLWDVMKAREKVDGVVRTVTLDQQFRMHPALGAFVSRWFYEAKGDPAIRSPRPAEEFSHELRQFVGGDGRERVAVWVDVPREMGTERGKPSPSRRCEAQRAARLALSILQADASLSVGVISFYRGQVDEIAMSLGELGVMESQGGAWRVRDEWRVGRGRDGEPTERFRLGTVDGFQGKEFDVVILSITRSNRLPAATDHERRRRYGHLLLDNRLCVAMSRQRRLLVAVGDLAFSRAAEAPPALRGFAQLCEGPDGLILD
ncbi:MAG: AAA domain-containing protein, partial [Polyangiales bacterium]